jgi:hypothetical protein
MRRVRYALKGWFGWFSAACGNVLTGDVHALGDKAELGRGWFIGEWEG